MMYVVLGMVVGLVFGYYYGKVIDKLTMEGMNRIESKN